MQGFGRTTLEPQIDLIPENFQQLKDSLVGFYGKGKNGKEGFNSLIIDKNLNFIYGGIWNTLYETTNDFPTFVEFYNHYLPYIKLSMKQAAQHFYLQLQKTTLFPGVTVEKIEKCFLVRLGNTFFGNNKEAQIFMQFLGYFPKIQIVKTKNEVDKYFKVDYCIKLEGREWIGMQVKPESQLNYDEGYEFAYHKAFEEKFGMKVFYLHYFSNKTNILFNGELVDIKNMPKIVEIMEKMYIQNRNSMV